jgi:hypothetical protein
VRGDQWSFERRDNFFLTTAGNILALDMLVQLVPSLNEGQRYGVFVREVLSNRKIYCVRNRANIAYSS